MENSELIELVNQLEQARLDYEYSWDDYSETRMQYSSEVSLYGDAWVGATDQLDRAYEVYSEAEEEYKALQSKLPPLQGCEEKKSWEYEEVPF